MTSINNLGIPCDSIDTSRTYFNPQIEWEYDIDATTLLDVEEDGEIIYMYVPTFDYINQPPQGMWADSSDDAYGYIECDFDVLYLCYKDTWYEYDVANDPLDIYEMVVDSIKQQMEDLE